MEWRRVLEGVGVATLFLVAIAMLGDPSRMFALLGSVDPFWYALSLLTTLGSVLVWSETLGVLLRAQGYAPRPGRFQVIFVAGMGLRSVVPGGSASGPAVVAYLLSRTTNVSGETSVAMAYVTEVLLWIGSAVVGSVGFVAILLVQPSPRLYRLAVALGGLVVIVFGVLAYGIRHPESIESAAHRVVTVPYHAIDGHSSRIARHLNPDRIEDRLDRFFESFQRLGDDPSHLIPALVAAIVGWFLHVATLLFVFVALDVSVSVGVALFVVPVGGLAEGLSVFPGGLGAIKPAFIGLLVFLTPMNLATATTAVVLYRISNYWFRIALGFTGVFGLKAGDLLQASLGELSTSG